MRLLSDQSVNNIVGFDLQAVDNWRLRLQIDMDLLDPNLKPAKREFILHKLNNYVGADPDKPFKSTADFYAELREKNHLSKIQKDSPLKPILDEITRLRDEKSADLNLVRVFSMTHGEEWGGTANLRHNELVAEFKTISKLLSERPKALEDVILEYVDNAVHDKSGNLIDGKLMPVHVDDLNLTDNPDLNLTIIEVAQFHDELDDDMKLHNALVGAKKLSELPKKYQKPEYEAILGIGLSKYPAWKGVKFPEPDNEMRVIRWKGSLGLVNDTNTIPEDLLPPLLQKEKEEEATIKSLFVRARTAKNNLFDDIIGISYIVASEYMIPEETAFTDEPIKVHGEMADNFFINIAWRPNKRIVGLREKERLHNEAVEKGSWILDYYFDSTEKKIKPASKWVTDPQNPKIVKKAGLMIPAHGIDILDSELYHIQEEHNNKVKAGLLKEPLWSFCDDPAFDRPLLDPRYRSDWRFEEMILGIYFPLIDLIRDYFTDSRTGKFWWKYVRHEWRLDKEILEKSIAIWQSKPANQFSAQRIHELLTNAFMRGAQSDFKLMELDDVMPHVENIMNRAPRLAEDVLTDDLTNLELLDKVKKLAQTKTFSQQNFTGLTNNIPKLVAQYKNMINVYPYAEMTPDPDMESGWYYTEQHPEDYLKDLGLEREKLELENDRKSLEFYLKFLEFAIQLLINDSNKPSSEKKYFVKVKKEEEEEEEEEKKPKKKKGTTKPKVSTEKELTSLMVRTHTNQDIGDELREFGKNHGFTERWGQTDLLHGKGDPIAFLIDCTEALARSSDFKDNANTQAFPGWIKDNVRDIEDKPDDMLHAYAFETKSLAKYVKSLLDLYYDTGMALEEIEKNSTGKVLYIEILQRDDAGDFVVIIWKSAKAILYERMMEHYKDDLSSMNADLENKASAFITQLPSLVHFENAPNTTDMEKLIPEALKDLIASSEVPQAKAPSLETRVRTMITKKEPDAVIISIEINGKAIEIQLEKALHDDASMAEELADKIGADYTFEFKTKGIASEFNL